MKKICIIIHLYYTDLWDEIKTYLENVNYDYDLHISLTQDNEKENSKFLERIKDLKNVTTYILENKGLDIGPFLYVFNEIVKQDLQYDLLLKLHTKKGLHGNRHPEMGEKWRKQLLLPILKDKETVEKIINIFDTNKEIGTVGSQKWFVTRTHVGFHYNLPYIREFTKHFGFKTEYNNIAFIGGTIFWSRFDTYKNFFINNDMISVYNTLETGAFTDSHAPKKTHAMERILAMIIYEDGKKIIGI